MDPPEGFDTREGQLCHECMLLAVMSDPPAPCASTNDGTCDEPDACDITTDSFDCVGPYSHAPMAWTGDHYQSIIGPAASTGGFLETNPQAGVLVAAALASVFALTVAFVVTSRRRRAIATPKTKHTPLASSDDSAASEEHAAGEEDDEEEDTEMQTLTASV